LLYRSTVSGDSEDKSTTFVVEELSRYRYEETFAQAIEQVFSMWTLWKGIEHEIQTQTASNSISNPEKTTTNLSTKIIRKLPSNFQPWFSQEFKQQLMKQIDILLRNELKKTMDGTKVAKCNGRMG